MRTKHTVLTATGLLICFGALPVFAQPERAAEKKASTVTSGESAPADPAAESATTATPGDVSTELQELKKEVQAMRSDLRAMLREIQLLKQAQAAKPPRQQQQRPAQQLLGKPAPEVTFKTANSTEMKLGGQSDKVKVVIFYATWCGYCKRALPGFEKLHKDYAGKDVEVMAICLDDREGSRGKSEEEVLAHFQQLGLSLPMYMDPKKEIGGKYKVSSYPTSFVVGKNGTIEAVHIGGPVDLDKTIAGEIDKLLAGQSLVSAQAKS